MTRNEIIDGIIWYVDYNGGDIPFNETYIEIYGGRVCGIGYYYDGYGFDNVGLYLGEYDIVTLEELSDYDLYSLFEHIYNFY